MMYHSLSVLNYQGSKKNLIPFIHSHADIPKGETILDIFSGTCSVGYSFKERNRIFANDCEKYSYIISQALLGNYPPLPHGFMDNIKLAFEANMEQITHMYPDTLAAEASILQKGTAEAVSEFYSAVPTVWNGGVSRGTDLYDLFLRYYSGSYFGVRQASEIDSIRFAIEPAKNTNLFAPLMTALYYAMKECVFAKDGHMAQPLDPRKNFSKLLKQRGKSVFPLFESKFLAFFSDDFVSSVYDNRSYNLNFEDLLSINDIQSEVDWIYADPPYTDMQYSRYYHILNFITQYEPLPMTVLKGTYTKGLYTEGRYQSKLSNRSKCLETFTSLVDFARNYRKNLIISFAYPADTTKQKTDRYVMNIDDLIASCTNRFGMGGVDVHSCEYSHTNNRNSKQKKVFEYLIVCRSN